MNNRKSTKVSGPGPHHTWASGACALWPRGKQVISAKLSPKAAPRVRSKTDLKLPPYTLRAIAALIITEHPLYCHTSVPFRGVDSSSSASAFLFCPGLRSIVFLICLRSKEVRSLWASGSSWPRMEALLALLVPLHSCANAPTECTSCTFLRTTSGFTSAYFILIIHHLFIKSIWFFSFYD